MQGIQFIAFVKHKMEIYFNGYRIQPIILKTNCGVATRDRFNKKNWVEDLSEK